MKQYQISGPDGIEALKVHEVSEPTLGPTDVLVDMKAWSLNFRDTIMLVGGYPGNDKVATNPPLIPLSDGAGEVVAVGDQVSRFKVGDRVAAAFFQEWISGELEAEQLGSALGGAIDGVLAERCAFHEKGLVRIPDSYSYAEAATLPCAAVTAWQALSMGELDANQTILVQGTGGVSIFALQFAKAMGAKVIVTSSSDEKLQQAKDLGADVTINYNQHPDWHVEVLNATGGRGVDHVIEVGGAGTLEKSFLAARVSGRVSIIGVLTGQPEQNPSPYLMLFRRLSVQGIYVGSRALFEELNVMLERQSIKPIIDKTFDFDDAASAYQHMMGAKHFGKVVIQR